MSYRQVIVQANSELQDELMQKLNPFGWHVLSADYVQNFKQPLDKKPVHVGLYEVNDACDQDCSQLDEYASINGHIEWIALVSANDLQNTKTCKFLKERFFDFHTLPLDIERLRISLGHAHGIGVLGKRDVHLETPTEHEGMIGNSPVMLNLYRAINKASKVDAPVLIGGESGTGKELAARAIHRMSERRDKAFVAVNCGALPANLIQTELFGHEKGAFTGAHQRKIGRMEAADGGTIFLDEIGDLPLDLQVNLLHVLQDKVIERVGSIQKIQLDVRVIAATHVDLELAVKQGRFREDLFYRLNVVHLKVPPLRDREGDLELLANAYLKQFAKEAKSHVTGFSRKALQAMRLYPWPGNVRQLINHIRQAVVMSENRLLTPEDLELGNLGGEVETMTLDMARAHAEREAIRLSLYRNQNNASEAARQLGISRATLYRLLERHDKMFLNLVPPFTDIAN